jgi:transposase InsO family protein
LLWLPVADATAATVVEALTILFVVHGAPLVLKSDNVSAFGAAVVQRLLAAWGVKNLFSPPRVPKYNGSIEAGIGSLTTRTERHAAQQGRPGFWSWDDTEAARQEANATARPRGENGPSPEEAWNSREPISTGERQGFEQTVARLQEEEAQAQGGPPTNPRDEQSIRARDRRAIRRALVEHGHLYFRRRRIPPPIPRRNAASIM